VFHGQAVAGECVGGIELQDFVEGGELVHGLILEGLAGSGFRMKV
jgi:hypothetical protein